LPKTATYEELNLLSRQYHQYNVMRVKSKVTISNLLDKTMPGISKLLRNSSRNDKLHSFVYEYWHFDNITCISEDKFVGDYQVWAKREGYQRSESKAKMIYALAREAIPTLNSNTPSTKMLVLEAVRVHREI